VCSCACICDIICSLAEMVYHLLVTYLIHYTLIIMAQLADRTFQYDVVNTWNSLLYFFTYKPGDFFTIILTKKFGRFFTRIGVRPIAEGFGIKKQLLNSLILPPTLVDKLSMM